MSKNSQLLSIVFISAAQLAVLLMGVTWFFDWIQEKSIESVSNRNTEIHQLVSRHFFSCCSILNLKDANIADDDWPKYQELIENCQIRDGGFASLVSGVDGSIICHPALNGGAFDLEHQLMHPQDGSLSDALQKQSQDNSRIYVNSGNQFFYVRSSKLPKQNTYLLTYHRPAQSGYISSHALASFRKLTFAIALIIGLTGTILNTFMVKRIMDEDHRVQLKLQDQVRDRTEELVRTKNATIFGLAKLAESRDNDTGEHLDRIRKYVTILANDLQSVYPEIDDEFINHLGIASSLHDIGKVGIPDSILLKPGRLTTHERNIMEKHTLIGGECLEAISDKLGDNDFLEMAKEVAYWHHEQWDGEGYPHRLREFEIPIAARIVAVADVYDALTSQRPYKRGLNHTESRAIIIGGSGQKFDPEIIAAFLRHEEEFQKIAAQFHNHESEEAAAVSGVVSLPSLNVANQSVAT